MNKHNSRKWQLAVASWIAATSALFTGYADFNQWMAAMTLIFGMYGIASVSDKKLNGEAA